MRTGRAELGHVRNCSSGKADAARQNIATRGRQVQHQRAFALAIELVFE